MISLCMLGWRWARRVTLPFSMRLMAYTRRLRRKVALNTVLKLPSPSSVAANAKSSIPGLAPPAGKSSAGGGGGALSTVGPPSLGAGRGGGAGPQTARWDGQCARWQEGPQYTTLRHREHLLTAPGAPHDAQASPIATLTTKPQNDALMRAGD